MADLQNIHNMLPIVDPATGLPTLYFMQLLLDKDGVLEEAEGLQDRRIIAGNGLDGGGTLAADITLTANEQEILDTISTTQGAILYRNANDWVALAPGTSGHFLKTLGAGANPAWAAASGGGGGGFEASAPDVPTTSGWTWENQSTASINSGTNMIYGLLPDGSGNYRGIYKTAPATPYNIYARVDLLTTDNITFADIGILVRASSDGDTVAFMLQWQGTTPVHYVRRMTSAEYATGGGAIVDGTNAIEIPSQPRWLRIENDGTNLNFYISIDGVNWFQTYTETIAAYIGTADQMGIIFRQQGTASVAKHCIYNFGNTAPSF